MKFHRTLPRGSKDNWADDIVAQVQLALHEENLQLPSLVNMTTRDLQYLALAFEHLNHPSLLLDRKLAEFP